MRTLLCVLICAVLSGAQSKPTKPGVERWPIKTSTPDGTNFNKPSKVALTDMLKMPEAGGVAKNDKRYQDARIPAQAGERYPEGRLVSTTGYLHLVAGETDGDYHIQISASASDGNNCLIVEVPNPGAEYTKTADLQPKFQAVRDFIKTKLLAGKDPAQGGSVMQHPPYVTVTGILFYDDSHVNDAPRGKKGMKAATLWELHPLTGMAFAVKPGGTTTAKR
jgi:hypothetical protein